MRTWTWVICSLFLLTPTSAIAQAQHSDARIAQAITVLVTHPTHRAYQSSAVVIKSTPKDRAYTNDALFLHPCAVDSSNKCPDSDTFVVQVENKQTTAEVVGWRCIERIPIASCQKSKLLGMLRFQTTQKMEVAQLSSNPQSNAACAVIDKQKSTACGTFQSDTDTITLSTSMPVDPIGAVVSDGTLIGVTRSLPREPYIAIIRINAINTMIPNRCSSISFFVPVHCRKQTSAMKTIQNHGSPDIKNNPSFVHIAQKRTRLTDQDVHRINKVYNNLDPALKTRIIEKITHHCRSNKNYVQYRLNVRHTCARFVAHQNTTEAFLTILRYVEFVPSLNTQKSEQGL